MVCAITYELIALNSLKPSSQLLRIAHSGTKSQELAAHSPDESLKCVTVFPIQGVHFIEYNPIEVVVSSGEGVSLEPTVHLVTANKAARLIG